MLKVRSMHGVGAGGRPSTSAGTGRVTRSVSMKEKMQESQLEREEGESTIFYLSEEAYLLIVDQVKQENARLSLSHSSPQLQRLQQQLIKGRRNNQRQKF